ncbi:MAG: hypothetical protein JJV98_00295 [Desulfosarcina sp.]|nr:hypothetical protein [Desulfobacterales bacterium]
MDLDRTEADRFGPGPDLSSGEIPWAAAASWNECRQSLQKAITASGAELAGAVAMARRIAHRYDLAGDLFDELAPTTCAVCRRPCCLDARVWLDFKDLLLIHLGGQPRPPHQLRRTRGEPCRYLTHHGCTLPRRTRPWVCTWYICPDQRRLLVRDIPGGRERLAKWWAEIAVLRDRMEDAFIAATRR